MEAIHSYLSAGTAVILGGLLAGIYTFYMNHLAAQNDIIKDYLSDLRFIEVLCREYWLFEGKIPDIVHENIGHELRTKLEATGVYCELSRSILGDHFTKFDELDQELFDVATGGTFQTAEYERSPITYAECMNAITEMRKLLREKRNAMFWTR